MGVWGSEDFALTEAQMTGSERFVAGALALPGAGRRRPLGAGPRPERLNGLLVEFLHQNATGR